MFQDQDFDSDSEDEDYVPNAVKAGSEDEVSSGEEDLLSDGEEHHGQYQGKSLKKPKNSKNAKSQKKSKAKLNRQINPLLAHLETETKTEEDIEESLEEADKPINEKEQKKNDDIWADFLADTEEKKDPVVSKPKKSSWADLLGKKKSKSSTSSSIPKETSKPVASASQNKDIFSKKSPEKPSTVKITKIFEFAGEEVRVEEEVAADSKEAALHSAASSSDPALLGAAAKRSSGLAGLIGSLGSKKQKLSTLEKSKLDWQCYKNKEGITDELKLHTKSKDTFIDKQEFLQRADQRQFEIERDIRLGVKRTNR